MTFLSVGGNSLARGGSRLSLTPPLQHWQEALANVASAPVDVVFFGDSVTQGFNATNHATVCAVALLYDSLANQYNTLPKGRGWVPPRTQDDGFGHTIQWDTVEGVANNYGLGGWGRTLTASSSQKLIITDTTDGFDLYYTVQKTGGSNLQVYVDNVLQTTLNTTDGTITPSQQSGRKWSSGALSLASHELKVIASGSGTAMVDGCYIHRNTRTSGIRVYNGGHGGAATQSFAKTTPFAGTGGYPGGLDHITTLQPALVVIDLGRNDPAFGGLTAAQHGQALGTLIDDIRNATPNSTILMVSSYKPSYNNLWDNWLDYRTQDIAVTAAKRVALLDEYAVMGEMTTSNYGSSDGLHPGDSGHSLIAGLFYDALT